jgi:ATP-dependent RNA helicase RhlE
MSDFKSLNLLQSILSEIQKKGYSKPTPIQAKSIPVLMEGRDLLGIAQTGTGKTASFSLPIIDRLGKATTRPAPMQARALILAPTRELATQIHKNICSYSGGLEITSAIVIGGVRKETQIEHLKSGMDIIVATPGRLMDLMSGGHLRFDELEIFVLDEADMMLDFGFFEDVKIISAKLPNERQTVLFSATMPPQIEELAKSLLVNPVKVQSAPQSTTLESIDQVVYFVEENDKLALLQLLLEDEQVERVLVFCKAKYGVVNVVEALEENGISHGEIHSNRTQGQRDQAIADFTDGKIRVLVATDIAARGIDVKDVTHVINFNLPDDATYYVHRIGRTGRAGKNGVAISLCGERDLALLRNVQKKIKRDIPAVLDHPFHKSFAPLVPKRKRVGSSASYREKKKPSQAKRRAKKKFLENL